MTAGKILLIIIGILLVRALFGFTSFYYVVDISFWLGVYWGVLKITDKVR
jgi:hypothetical protein